MKRTIFIRWSVVTTLFLALTITATAQEKRRIAVFDFDYATVSGSVYQYFGSNQDVGKGIADLLVTKLVQSGVYTVVERKQIEKILAEQNFGASGRVDEATAAKIGKILGIDVIIVGSINTFGRDDSSKTTAGGGVRIPGSLPGLGGMRVGRNKAKAVVGINYRMINSTTAEIFHAGDARGESKRESTSVSGGGGIIGEAVGAGARDMSSSNFAETIIGEAVYSAVGQISAQLESKASSLPAREMKAVEGMVAEVAGSILILNVGKNAGIKVGDKLLVERPIKEVKDPETGKVLRVLSDKIGEVVITEVDDVSAVGKYTGTQPAKVKDKVKSEKK